MLAPTAASALILTSLGNSRVPDPGWPDGARGVANLKSRAGWWEGPPFGGGESHFIYHGDAAALEEAIEAFGDMRAPALDLVLHDGPAEDVFIKGPMDWAFTVWIPANWHRLYNNLKVSSFLANSPNFRQPVPAPRLDVYLGGTNRLNWSQIKVPGNIRVRDERAAAAAVHPVGGGLLRVDVYDMATGKTIVGARVLLSREAEAQPNPPRASPNGSEAESGADGRAEISRIPAGTYQVTVLAEGYSPRQSSSEKFDAGTSRQLTVDLAATASLEGVVVDAAGKAMKDVAVRTSTVMGLDGRGYSLALEPWAQTNRAGDVVLKPTAQTDAAGHFSLSGLPTGYAFLVATAPGYHYQDYATLFGAPETNAVLHLAIGGTVQVQVQDRDGHALPRFEGREIMVHIEPKAGSTIGSWGGGATVKTDGSCEFSAVPAGEYRLTCRPNPSHANQPFAPDQQILVTPGQVTRVQFTYE